MVKVTYEIDHISSTLIMHAVNQKKKKKVHKFLRARYKKKTKSQSTNHLNSSSHEKICDKLIVAMALPKMSKKKKFVLAIVAMPLPKMEKKL